MTDAAARTPMLEVALGHAAAGRPVFPCDPASKKPLNEHGFKDATADPALIRAWWVRHPHAMIGMPTGAASRLVALDLDVDPGKGLDGIEAMSALGALPPTAEQRTPRGGIHKLFQFDPAQDVRNSASKLAPGVDVRGEGGYIILAGSRRDDGQTYEWVRHPQDGVAHFPDWLAARLAAPKAPATTAQPRAGVTTPAAERALRDAAWEVERAAEGTRNDTLNRAAFRVGQAVAAGGMTEEFARDRLLSAAQAAGLPADEALTTISSGLRAGTEATPEPTRPRRRGRDEEVQITEDEAAEAFAREMADRIRFVHPIGPHLWDGSRWRAEDMNQSLDLARHHNRDLAADLGAEGARYRSVSFARAVLDFAGADPALALTADRMNADPMFLGTPGGTVDLRTGELHDANPDDFITRSTTVAPDAEANCPRWLKFLDEAMSGDAEMVAFLRRMAGYMLTGETREHALFFAHGPGKNGKSTFVETLQGLMGDYATPAPMSTFTAKKFDSHPTELADLNGARLVTASETEEGQQWAEARIKQVTGGDAIKARFMRQDFFTFSPVFKLLIMGNVAPVLNTVDAAIKRRFNFIPFAYTPPDSKKDPYLRDKLEAEWPGILRWAIEGCLEWQRLGLNAPAGVVAATESYFADQDVFSQWLEDECQLEPTRERGAKLQTFELTKVLFASWVSFSDKAGGAAPNTRTFSDALKRHGLIPGKRGRSDRGWHGITLTTEAKRAADRALGHGSEESF